MMIHFGKQLYFLLNMLTFAANWQAFINLIIFSNLLWYFVSCALSGPIILNHLVFFCQNAYLGMATDPCFIRMFWENVIEYYKDKSCVVTDILETVYVWTDAALSNFQCIGKHYYYYHNYYYSPSPYIFWVSIWTRIFILLL